LFEESLFAARLKVEQQISFGDELCDLVHAIAWLIDAQGLSPDGHAFAPCT
jgi:hypothetical protein